MESRGATGVGACTVVCTTQRFQRRELTVCTGRFTSVEVTDEAGRVLALFHDFQHLINETYPKPDVTEKAWLCKVCPYIRKRTGSILDSTYGGIKEISVLDPLPGLVGFRKVVSIRVHPSPLNPQLPANARLGQWAGYSLTISLTGLKVPIISNGP